MPYKSDSQRRFFHAAEERGEISPKTVHEFDEASKGKHLPEKMFNRGKAKLPKLQAMLQRGYRPDAAGDLAPKKKR